MRARNATPGNSSPARSPAGPAGPAGDYQVELTAAARTAVAFTAFRRWVTENGVTPITALITQAIAAVEPLFAALTAPSAGRVGE